MPRGVGRSLFFELARLDVLIFVFNLLSYQGKLFGSRWTVSVTRNIVQARPLLPITGEVLNHMESLGRGVHARAETVTIV